MNRFQIAIAEFEHVLYEKSKMSKRRKKKSKEIELVLRDHPTFPAVPNPGTF